MNTYWTNKKQEIVDLTERGWNVQVYAPMPNGSKGWLLTGEGTSAEQLLEERVNQRFHALCNARSALRSAKTNVCRMEAHSTSMAQDQKKWNVYNKKHDDDGWGFVLGILLIILLLAFLLSSPWAHRVAERLSEATPAKVIGPQTTQESYTERAQSEAQYQAFLSDVRSQISAGLKKHELPDKDEIWLRAGQLVDIALKAGTKREHIIEFMPVFMTQVAEEYRQRPEILERS
jgi:hypothetical protein